MLNDIEEIIVRRTLRVPVPEGPLGDGSAVVRQFDVALMDAGYKLSDDLFAKLTYLEPGTVIDLAVRTLATVKKMVGGHVQHNTYFIDFPKNVPDNVEFWVDRLVNALYAMPELAAQFATDTIVTGSINLLDLPDYGRYRHSYADMLAHHLEFIQQAGDRVTVLQAGEPTDFEARDLYLKMAASRVPGNDLDREDLRKLTYGQAFDFVHPEVIPVRENRALINEVRVELGVDPLVDTVTDVLRLACALSGGDVTLVEDTDFKSFTRRTRKVLLKALHDVVTRKPEAVGDINQHAMKWKRLGERLHPGDYKKYTGAAEAFNVARGDLKAPSIAGVFEQIEDPLVAAMFLRQKAPGMLLRAADRLLRLGPDADIQLKTALEIVDAADDASGRLLFSLREHVLNRLERSTGKRLFVNQSGRGKVVPDTRGPISKPILQYLAFALDAKIRDRVFDGRRWVIDPAASGIALPISGKTIAGGFGTLPRGSVLPVEGDTLRFFMYWHQTSRRTDYDLSALNLTDDGEYHSHVSWTNYRTGGRGGWAVYSGDITNAPHGASEFIDIDLRRAPCSIIVPQVHIFSGEGFDEVKESFFGFMLRDRDQEGAPFEPRTVRMKSELRGAGTVALPMMFNHDENWNWQAVWMNLTLAGNPPWGRRNQSESSRATATDLVKAVLTQKRLTVGYLAELAGRDESIGEEPVVYVGFEAPDNLPKGSTVITLTNLTDLIPE